MACGTDGCSNEKVFARGLCQGCYFRQRRNGSVARKNIQNAGRTCLVPGCDKAAFAKGLCTRHYHQAQHPLNHAWRILRSRSPDAYPSEWNRFEAFVKDVGERPTPKHQLRRVDPTLSWSVTNFVWLPPVSLPDTYTPDQRKAYEREWRFQRKFGITVADYDRMLAEQSGLCAICRRPPTQVHAKSGKLRDLAVDHDHETNAVRGLLCTDCNVVLGLVEDRPDRLEAMVAYLERHRTPHLVRTGEAA